MQTTLLTPPLTPHTQTNQAPSRKTVSIRGSYMFTYYGRFQNACVHYIVEVRNDVTIKVYGVTVDEI